MHLNSSWRGTCSDFGTQILHGRFILRQNRPLHATPDYLCSLKSKMDNYTTVLCNDAVGLIFQMKASMEFWDALKGEHFSISQYGDINWDISGEGAPDEEPSWPEGDGEFSPFRGRGT